MSSKLLRALNLCSALFVTLAFFPPLAVYYAFTVTPQSVPTVGPVWLTVIEMAVCIACGFLGRGLGNLCDKLSMSSAVRRILELPLLAVLGTLLYLAFGFLGFYQALAAGIFGALSFAVTGGMRFRTYDEVLSRRLFFWYSIGYGAVLIFLEFAEKQHVGSELFAAFLFVGLVLMLFGTNQSGIDFMMKRRQHKFDQLPQKIRNYNVRLFLISSTGLLVLFLLYQPIAQLLSVLFVGLKEGLLWILTHTPEVPSDDMDGGTLMPDQGPGDKFDEKEWKDPTFFGSLSMVLVVVAVFLLIYYRKPILAMLKKFWEKIKDLLSDLLWGGRQDAARAKNNEENEYYTETEERVDEDTEEKKKSSAALRRKWRHDCRKFISMDDSPEAMRAGYGLILRGIRLKGIPVAVSQTTLEICQTVEEKGLPPLQASTNGYNSLRYGEKEFEPSAMTEIRKAVNELMKYKEA